MKLGKYFTLNELTITNSGLLNIPNAEQTANLKLLVENVLDPLRELYGKPIKVNSGFRSTLVNAHVKGAKNSQHCLGMAADLDCDDNKKLFELIRKNFLFDQVIDENGYSWIHVSFKKEVNRNEALRMKNGKYTKA